MYNHQLDTFIRVAESGSFGKAAASLYISTPAVIQQINILEDHFGFKLFERSSRGVKLTHAGRSVYEDAKSIIRMSNKSLERARRLIDASENRVRIGTSVLFKCRMLPELWTRVHEISPGLKIEIVSIPEKQTRNDSIDDLGTKYDICEGVFASAALKKKCDFLKLADTPVCCAVSKKHRLSGQARLTLDDLNGEHIVMPIEGASAEMDIFRQKIVSDHPEVTIVDSPYYGVDTFTMCEINQYVLITQLIYADIHTNLITVPLDTDFTMPYGLVYSKDATPATKKFISAIEDLKEP